MKDNKDNKIIALDNICISWDFDSMTPEMVEAVKKYEAAKQERLNKKNK